MALTDWELVEQVMMLKDKPCASSQLYLMSALPQPLVSSEGREIPGSIQLEATQMAARWKT